MHLAGIQIIVNRNHGRRGKREPCRPMLPPSSLRFFGWPIQFFLPPTEKTRDPVACPPTWIGQRMKIYRRLIIRADRFQMQEVLLGNFHQGPFVPRRIHLSLSRNRVVPATLFAPQSKRFHPIGWPGKLFHCHGTRTAGCGTRNGSFVQSLNKCLRRLNHFHDISPFSRTRRLRFHPQQTSCILIDQPHHVARCRVDHLGRIASILRRPF